MKNKAAQQLGRKGGKVTSETKAESARENGSKGGRPVDLSDCVIIPQTSGKVIIHVQPGHKSWEKRYSPILSIGGRVKIGEHTLAIIATDWYSFSGQRASKALEITAE